MPMDFPDFDSLKKCAKVWRFRDPIQGETEAHFRVALADFVQPQDLVESCEIRNKVGWDKFKDFENFDMIQRAKSR